MTLHDLIELEKSFDDVDGPGMDFYFALHDWFDREGRALAEDVAKGKEVIRAALMATDPTTSAANVPIDWARLKTACDKYRAAMKETPSE